MAEHDIRRLRARIAALEHVVIMELRAEQPEFLMPLAVNLQDGLIDRTIRGKASTAFRAGFKQERQRLAAMLGAPILGEESTARM